MDKEVNK